MEHARGRPKLALGLSSVWSQQALRRNATVSQSCVHSSTPNVNNFGRQDLGYRLAHDPSLSGISVIGVDPGAMGSDLARRGSFILSTLMMKTVMPLIGPVMVRMSPNGPFRTGWKSGGDVVSACFDIETPKNTLYLNGSEEMEVAKDARDGEKRRVLWRYGIEAAGIKEGDTILKNWQ